MNSLQLSLSPVPESTSTRQFQGLPEMVMHQLLRAGDVDKVKRRLAQNREAARKSRQRRKAYVQNLEEEVRCSYNKA